MIDNLIDPGNACDDSTVQTLAFPDEAAEAEYRQWVEDSRRNEEAWLQASGAAPDSAYAAYVEAHYAVCRAHAARVGAEEIGRLVRAEQKAWEAVEVELDATEQEVDRR
jgi:hypothetical protein